MLGPLQSLNGPHKRPLLHLRASICAGSRTLGASCAPRQVGGDQEPIGPSGSGRKRTEAKCLMFEISNDQRSFPPLPGKLLVVLSLLARFKYCVSMPSMIVAGGDG